MFLTLFELLRVLSSTLDLSTMQNVKALTHFCICAMSHLKLVTKMKECPNTNVRLINKKRGNIISLFVFNIIKGNRIKD